jgi:hypothetical protein
MHNRFMRRRVIMETQKKILGFFTFIFLIVNVSKRWKMRQKPLDAKSKI